MFLKKNHNHIRIFHHGNWTINVTKSVDMKNAPPPGHFHEEGTINVASRVLKSHIKKNAPPPGANVFQPTGTNFELAQDIVGQFLLTKYHDDAHCDQSPTSAESESVVDDDEPH
ncbi:hypothetical protein DPMN_107763 [Dreissena polymorpha]|uniref:Uncharacterized protein n=1 Tax=Dreissena polymorpha TaxID=45954 RepID=A0A9D4K7I1_DREPO|nr:hypothetical protein DPMN_107763 [Dreissena polymorpha]